MEIFEFHIFFFFGNPYFTSVLEDFFNILSPLLGPLLLLGAFAVKLPRLWSRCHCHIHGESRAATGVVDIGSSLLWPLCVWGRASARGWADPDTNTRHSFSCVSLLQEATYGCPCSPWTHPLSQRPGCQDGHEPNDVARSTPCRCSWPSWAAVRTLRGIRMMTLGVWQSIPQIHCGVTLRTALKPFKNRGHQEVYRVQPPDPSLHVVYRLK